MTETILIEPADEHRQGFARWCLAQEPKIMTANAFGSEVPTELFSAVPSELLEGAYIDGRMFRPALAGFEPDGDGYRAVVPTDDGAKPEPVKAPAKKTAARRTRKAQEGAE